LTILFDKLIVNLFWVKIVLLSLLCNDDVTPLNLYVVS